MWDDDKRISQKGLILNIDHIKKKIIELQDFKLKIKINLGRNKYEYYEGKIKKIHQNLFTVETDRGIKSFTYADVITKVVILTKI